MRSGSSKKADDATASLGQFAKGKLVEKMSSSDC